MVWTVKVPSTMKMKYTFGKKKTRRIFYAQTNNGYTVTLRLYRLIFLFSNFKVSL